MKSEISKLEDISSTVVFEPRLSLSSLCFPFEEFEEQIKDEGGKCVILCVNRFTDATEVQFLVTKAHAPLFRKLFEEMYTLVPGKGYTKKLKEGIPGKTD